MDLQTFRERLAQIPPIIKAQGYPYGAECFSFVNHSGDQLSVVAKGNIAERLVGQDFYINERGDIEEAEDLIRRVCERIYALPSAHDRRVEQLTRKLGEIAALCEQGAVQQDAYKATWEALQQMMRRQQEYIAKNGLPAPRELSNVQTIDAAE